MKEKDPFSLFSEAGHHPPAKKKATPQKKTPIAITPPSKSSNFATEIANANSEREKIKHTIKTLQEDLLARLTKIHASVNMNADEIREYLDNPRNFKVHEWDAIQRQRASLEKSILSMIKKAKGKMADDGPASSIAKGGGGDVKDRKGKTLGSRKKWIPIR